MLSIHHIGYLVKNIDKALLRFEELGYNAQSEPVYDEGRQADIVFLKKDGYCIELVCPHKNSDIYSLLKKTGNSPYHICYAADDLDAETARLEDMGYTVFIGRTAAPAIGDKAEVVFLYHMHMGMVELVGDNN